MADPPDALGVEPVDWLVEEEDAGITEHCRGDAEPLGHAKRELTHPPVGHRRQPHLVQDLVDPAGRNVVSQGQPPQVVPGGASRVKRFGVKQCADLAEGQSRSQ